MAVSAFIASGIYLILYTFTDFEIFGVWPAVLGVLASIATIIWRTARKDDDYEDGAFL
jgi:hypothetical protein